MSRPAGDGSSDADGWYEIALEVRDYELDFQGIVNNANYLHYFEHARNSFVRERGIDLLAMHGDGVDAVVHRAEIDYRVPLRGRERFTVRCRASREGRLKLVFEESIVKEGGLESAHGRFVVALLRGGRPVPVEDETLRALSLARPSPTVPQKE
jgi:acyl-CoA thioester hydrolase